MSKTSIFGTRFSSYETTKMLKMSKMLIVFRKSTKMRVSSQ